MPHPNSLRRCSQPLSSAPESNLTCCAGSTYRRAGCRTRSFLFGQSKWTMSRGYRAELVRRHIESNGVRQNVTPFSQGTNAIGCAPVVGRPACARRCRSNLVPDRPPLGNISIGSACRTQGRNVSDHSRALQQGRSAVRNPGTIPARTTLRIADQGAGGTTIGSLTPRL